MISKLLNKYELVYSCWLYIFSKNFNINNDFFFNEFFRTIIFFIDEKVPPSFYFSYFKKLILISKLDLPKITLFHQILSSNFINRNIEFPLTKFLNFSLKILNSFKFPIEKLILPKINKEINFKIKNLKKIINFENKILENENYNFKTYGISYQLSNLPLNQFPPIFLLNSKFKSVAVGSEGELFESVSYYEKFLSILQSYMHKKFETFVLADNSFYSLLNFSNNNSILFKNILNDFYLN